MASEFSYGKVMQQVTYRIPGTEQNLLSENNLLVICCPVLTMVVQARCLASISIGSVYTELMHLYVWCLRYMFVYTYLRNTSVVCFPSIGCQIFSHWVF